MPKGISFEIQSFHERLDSFNQIKRIQHSSHSFSPSKIVNSEAAQVATTQINANQNCRYRGGYRISDDKVIQCDQDYSAIQNDEIQQTGK